MTQARAVAANEISDTRAGSKRVPRILVLADYYLPGMRQGGPVTTIRNTCEALDGKYRFAIVTRDRDRGESEPYQNVKRESWNGVGAAAVYYTRVDLVWPVRLWRLIHRTRSDVIYLNSFFSPCFTLLPLVVRKLGRGRATPVVVAPRGELAAGALGLKRTKKRVFLWAARKFGIYRGVTWQATSVHEERDIHGMFGRGVRAVVIPNLPSIRPLATRRSSNEKERGRARIVYLSRIGRMKNLLCGLRCIGRLSGTVELDIYGPVEDEVYWKECEQLIASLPPHVTVRYRGTVDPGDTGRVLSEYDLFLLPTLGENFGHAIIEALSAGCPVVISDRTPWSGVDEAGAGWAVPIESEEGIVRALQAVVDMSDDELGRFRRNARRFAERIGMDGSSAEALDVFLREVLTGGGRSAREPRP